MKRITANKRMEQWKTLLHQTNHNQIPSIHMDRQKDEDNHVTDETKQNDHDTSDSGSDVDPFDCSELIIPDTKQLIQNTLQPFIQEWEELDSRIIKEDVVGPWRGRKRKRVHIQPSDDEDCNSDGGDNDGDKDGDKEKDEEAPNEDENDDENRLDEEGGQNGGPDWTYNANRIRLPDFFDYASKGPPPEPPDAPNATQNQYPKRRQVVSLQDPTKRLDYERELWNIFQKVPLEADLEASVVEGAICTHMLALNQEIQDAYRDYTRLDGHSLSRLRKKDRHYWPRSRMNPSMTSALRPKRQFQHERNRQRQHEIQRQRKPIEIDCATIKMEFWKKATKRFGTDPYKCEMEFLSTHTLQDVHNAIVELSEDVLFQQGLATSCTRATATNGASSPSSSSSSISPQRGSSSSGYFFIEDAFFSTGDVDYTTPIVTWLNQNLMTKRSKFLKCRKNFLKIGHGSNSASIDNGTNTNMDPPPLQQKRMEEVPLGDIPFRLGVRYVHVCNGDCETSVFFSDITMRTTDEDGPGCETDEDGNAATIVPIPVPVPKSAYPLLHDVWTMTTASSVHGVGVCEGCDHNPAVVVTIEDEMCGGGPTPLCASCYSKLHYEKDGKLKMNNFKVFPMTVLQNLRDLSVWHDYTDAPF